MPESIGQLAQIQKLNVSNNQLTALPESLRQIKTLTELDLDRIRGDELHGYQVLGLPADLLGPPAAPAAILDYYFSTDRLDANLHEAERRIQIAKQTGSNALDLGGLQLTNLPESIGQLTQLRDLLVHTNRLTALPESISNLTHLRNLDVRRNQLKTLPEFIGQLTQLKKLRADCNILASLPKFIGELSQLESLVLDSNELTTLPDTLGQLTQLRTLSVCCNQLSSLPNALGRLTQLRDLFVHGNQLTELPECLGKLTQLWQLSVSDNELVALPESLRDLKQLETLDLRGNEALGLDTNVLTQIYEQNQSDPTAYSVAILDHYFSERRAECSAQR